MADYGFRVTKDGQDARTAADKDLVYSSKYNGMKIAKHGTTSAGNVAHGLGYIPTFLNFRETSGKYGIDSQAYSDITNIVFPDSGNYYFIFIDKA